MLRKQWRQIALTLPKIAGTIALKSDIPTAQDLSTYVSFCPALTGIPTVQQLQ
jgi:hypothetical protein